MTSILEKIFGARLPGDPGDPDPDDEAKRLDELAEIVVNHEETLKAVESVLSGRHGAIAVALDDTVTELLKRRRKRR